MTVSGLTRSNAERQSFHNRESQTHLDTINPIEAELVKTARTLQDQELMPESKNLCLQKGAGSETISEREK